jgi:iron complex outermembrane receptor protein
MKKYLTLILMLVLGGVYVLGIFQPAIAQEDDEFTLEEIVVTAQKREQNVKDIPVALSVISENKLENYDVKNFDDVARISPSLSIDQGLAPSGNTIRMRGVGTVAFSIAADPSVSVVIDDMPFLRQAQAFNNLVDIERIEVLRGPQGTLFGKNASAGVVSIITKAPSQEFTGKVTAGFTDDDEKKVGASLSGPLNESLGYRVSAYYLERDGYIKNLVDGSDLNGEEAKGARAKLTWQASDNLDMALTFDTSKREGSTATTWADADPEVAGEGVTPSEDNRTVRYDTTPRFEIDQNYGIFKINYDFAGHTLTSITSYQNYDLISIQDQDMTDIPINPFNPFLNPLGLTGPTIEQSSDENSDGFTQELRLTSKNSKKFEYMVGFYYSDVKTIRDFYRVALRFTLANWEAEATTESMALFSQNTLTLTDKTFFDFGFRLNREKIGVDFTDYFANGFVLGDPGETYKGDDSENAVTGKVALRHYLESGPMGYASVSTGYKGQAYDITSSFTQETADEPVGSETSISYEVGMKGFSGNGRLSYDVAAFLTDFKDFQAQGGRLVGQEPVFQLNNVGELRTKGVEVDLAYRATEGLQLNASMAYTDATIESFENANCYDGQTEAEGCMIGGGPGGLDVQDLSGKPLNNSPDFKFNVGAYWELVLSSLPFNFFAQANYQWQDDVNYDLLGNPLSAQEAYGLANISFGIVEPVGRYRVTFFVNNLFDEDFSMGYTDFSARFPGYTALGKQWNRNAMRYMGINVSYSF